MSQYLFLVFKRCKYWFYFFCIMRSDESCGHHSRVLWEYSFHRFSVLFTHTHTNMLYRVIIYTYRGNCVHTHDPVEGRSCSLYCRDFPGLKFWHVIVIIWCAWQYCAVYFFFCNNLLIWQKEMRRQHNPYSHKCRKTNTKLFLAHLLFYGVCSTENVKY